MQGAPRAERAGPEVIAGLRSAKHRPTGSWRGERLVHPWDREAPFGLFAEHVTSQCVVDPLESGHGDSLDQVRPVMCHSDSTWHGSEIFDSTALTFGSASARPSGPGHRRAARCRSTP